MQPGISAATSSTFFVPTSIASSHLSSVRFQSPLGEYRAIIHTPAWCRVSSTWILYRFTSNGLSSILSNRGTAEAITGLGENMKTNHFAYFALLEQRRSITPEVFFDFPSPVRCLNHCGLKMPALLLSRKRFRKSWILLTCPIFDTCGTNISPSLIPKTAIHPVFTGSLPLSEFQKTRSFT